MRYIFSTFFAAMLVVGLVSVQTAQAALTEAQITAVVDLVSSFGADAATIKNTEASLRGQATPGVRPMGGMPNADTMMREMNVPPRACPALMHHLRQGMSDAKTEGEVTKLQQFLKDEGEFKETKATGFFGPATARALMQWQKKQGIMATPNSGAGPMTREKMRVLCAGMMPKPLPVATSTTPMPVVTPMSTTTATTTVR